MMKSCYLKISILILLLTYCLGCVGPHLTLKQDTTYEQTVPETTSAYLLGPGDVLEIIYHHYLKPSSKEYVLEVGDIIKIDFYLHTDLNREVIIRPDGKTTLPIKGDIPAAGLTPSELARILNKIYEDTFRDPGITVTLVEFNQAIKDFHESIRSRTLGQSKLFPIRPDGYITFPLIKDIKAAGLTLDQLRRDVSYRYNGIIPDLSFSLVLKEIKSNLVYVMGEVARPDFYIMETPTLVSQIMARAGVNLNTARLDSIIVISRTTDGKPVGRLVNLDKILGQGNIGNDVLLRQYDIVFVPRSRIMNAGLFVEQYINQLIPRAVRLNFTYRIDD